METTPKIWDPIRDTIDVRIFQHDLLQKLAYYQKRPYLPLLNSALFTLLGVVIFCFSIMYSVDDLEWYVIGFIPVVSYVSYILLLQKKLVLLMMSQKNNWLYDPGEESTRAHTFSRLFPQVFDKGHTQTFSLQIWGIIPYHNATLPFWSTKFTYVTGHGKHRSSYDSYIFAFPLPKILPVSITLQKAPLLSMGRDMMQTESHEFNQTFRISSPQETTEVKQEILSVLSPSVQTRLLDFAKVNSFTQIIFHHDLMLIELPNPIWTTHHTNFFFSPNISEKDVELSNTALLTMAELPSEMIQFMD